MCSPFNLTVCPLCGFEDEHEPDTDAKRGYFCASCGKVFWHTPAARIDDRIDALAARVQELEDSRDDERYEWGDARGDLHGTTEQE